MVVIDSISLQIFPKKMEILTKAKDYVEVMFYWFFGWDK